MVVLRRVALAALAVIPWAVAASVILYASQTSGFDLRQGDIIRLPRPEMMERARMALLVLWWTVALLLAGVTLVVRLRRGGRPLPIAGVACAVVLLVVLAREWAAVLLWVWALLVTGIGAYERRRLKWLTYMAIVVLILPLSLAYLDFRTRFPAWGQRTELTLEDGRVYQVQRVSFLQASQDVLAERLPDDQLFSRSRVIGTSPYGGVGAPLVRPAGVERYHLKKPGELISGRSVARLVTSTDERRLVLIFPREYPKRGAGCLGDLAYDLEDFVFCGGDGVHSLSPFILVGADDELEASDVEMLLDAQANAPLIDALLVGVDHENPRVRALVVKALVTRREYGARAKLALARIAKEDEDARVRRAAGDALVALRGR